MNVCNLCVYIYYKYVFTVLLFDKLMCIFIGINELYVSTVLYVELTYISIKILFSLTMLNVSFVFVFELYDESKKAFQTMFILNYYMMQMSVNISIFGVGIKIAVVIKIYTHDNT